MDIREKYKSDLAFLFSKEGQFGHDLWTTKDNRIGKGSPYSTRDVAIMLSELGYTREDIIIQKIAELIFTLKRPDGRFKISPSGAIYPCHTIAAFRVLCSLGYANDERLSTTIDHLFDIKHEDGGWRCNAAKIGLSENMDHSNPGPTLEALDAFRYTKYLNTNKRLDEAVEFLLYHWVVKKPLGPCYFGIGSLFMQTEFPFLRYNLFYYVHTLSFYKKAQKDARFLEALALLEKKLKDNQLIIENPHRYLGKLDFCKKGQPSEIATMRYMELKERISK